MSFEKAQQLLELATFVAARRMGVTLDDVGERFGTSSITGRPPALPGRQYKFDIYGGRPSPKPQIVSHHAHEMKFDDGQS